MAKLTDEIREDGRGNDFVEIHLDHWKTKLCKLIDKLDVALNVSLRQDATSLATNISVDISSKYFDCMRCRATSNLELEMAGHLR